MSPFDRYTARMLGRGSSGVRIVVSMGTRNKWHAYIILLGLKGGEKRVLETTHHETYMDALSALEEKVVSDLRLSVPHE